MIDTILYPIQWVVAWIMYGSHQVLTALGMQDGPGLAWVLSIVALTIVIRILLIPLFFKQIKASRGMQIMQPELQAIQKKYKGKTDPSSREAMGRETMELYRKHGTNPFASCMPVLLQSPIFFALFRVLYNLQPIATAPRTRSVPSTRPSPATSRTPTSSARSSPTSSCRRRTGASAPSSSSSSSR